MTRTLYLLRHAKSSWDDPSLADHDRPLAPRGLRASSAIAEHLHEGEIAPALVLCSPAARTRETLTRISAGFDAESEVEVEIEPGIYEASAADLLARLRRVPDAVASVMLIGHNPATRELALELAGGGERLERVREKFPTAALATLAIPVGWSELGPGSARLIGFVRPRDLE